MVKPALRVPLRTRLARCAKRSSDAALPSSESARWSSWDIQTVRSSTAWICVGVLRRIRSEIVIGMNFDLRYGERGNVNHADHRAIGLAVLDACRDAANEWLFSDLGRP